jgi:hypothetical protein
VLLIKRQFAKDRGGILRQETLQQGGGFIPLGSGQRILKSLSV